MMTKKKKEDKGRGEREGKVKYTCTFKLAKQPRGDARKIVFSLTERGKVFIPSRHPRYLVRHIATSHTATVPAQSCRYFFFTRGGNEQGNWGPAGWGRRWWGEVKPLKRSHRGSFFGPNEDPSGVATHHESD